MANENRRFLHTQQAAVVFKGIGQDVHVILDPHVPFLEIEKELQDHLERSGHFFEGAAVTLIVGSRQLRDEHLQTLRQALTEHGLTIAQIQASLGEGPRLTVPPPPLPRTPMPVSTPQPTSRRERLARESEVSRNNALLIKGTLRSGQRISAEHNLVIFGDVNPGAELIAGGDIMVIGTLRGVAHAGVPDMVEAVIAALSLQPTQLRIAHFISRSPEFQDKHDSGPEIAKIDGQQIVVESFPRRLLGPA
ncbi:MAG: septum site-determining protein MinC [Nitrospinae bacterium]|nr:septum site-determining protein MinC [Nitrospinota bacterium]